jgi:hypothetical protein
MTLGSLWQLLARKTKRWMIGGTACVLAGTVAGVLILPAFVGSGGSGPLLLLPSLTLCLGGGYAVLFPGIAVSRTGVRIHRDWLRHPRAGQVLWVLSLAVAVAGLVACIVSGLSSPLAPGLLVWVFMGIYLVLTGWASALMGAAEVLRQNKQEAPVQATVPSR